MTKSECGYRIRSRMTRVSSPRAVCSSVRPAIRYALGLWGRPEEDVRQLAHIGQGLVDRNLPWIEHRLIDGAAKATDDQARRQTCVGGGVKHPRGDRLVEVLT